MDRHRLFRARFLPGMLRPGYEIWFAVVVDSRSRQALWIRYSTLYPRPGSKYRPRTVLWASLFDALNPDRHCFGASPSDGHNLKSVSDGYTIPGGQLSLDRLTGSLSTHRGTLSWDLSVQHRLPGAAYGPSWLGHPSLARVIPTHSVACSPFARLDGDVTLDGDTTNFEASRGNLTHIWGTTRIHQLGWVSVPVFDDDPEDWSLEITAVKLAARAPALVFVTLSRQGRLLCQAPLTAALRGRAKFDYPYMNFSARLQGWDIYVRAALDERQITPYIYRDPNGSARYVEQSDLGDARCWLRRGGRVAKLNSHRGAAVEFHGPSPWSPRNYLDPYVPSDVQDLL